MSTPAAAKSASATARHNMMRPGDFDASMAHYLKDPLAALDPASGLLQALIDGWANPWSGQQEFLAACLRHALIAEGPILECGSGLTTLLVGGLAQRRQLGLFSLEHQASWVRI